RRSSPASSPPSRRPRTPRTWPRSGASRTRTCWRSTPVGPTTCGSRRRMGRGLLEGRVALITGAGQGLGRAIAREYADEGATVALLERNPETLEATRSELAGRGRTVLAYALDLTDHAAYRAAVEDVVARQGGLDVLVSNAAVAYYATILDHGLEEWRRTIAVNLESVFIGAQL